jgi:hypothetical protein
MQVMKATLVLVVVWVAFCVYLLLFLPELFSSWLIAVTMGLPQARRAAGTAAP